MSRNNNAPKKHTGCMVVLILLILAMIAGTVFMIKLCLDVVNQGPPVRDPVSESIILPQTGTEAPETEAPTETTMPEPEHVVSTATIASTGDILMHLPVINTGLQSNGTYNFDSIFSHLAEYAQAADYAVANLETTLCGTDNGYSYSGYPLFNCPDAIVDSVVNAGFDMMLTANNHSYDTSLVGYKRTLETVRGRGMETLGTYASADETKWTIVDINGINIGMLCYTYANYATEDGRPSLNGNAPIAEAGLCNYFTYENRDAFFNEVDTYLEEMEEAGAEATIMYIHWGVEYILYPNDNQKTIAQGLCDLGIDVIVGGHPHVIQPVALLDSTTDPNHKTVCLYSMGNAVSNQRLGNIKSISTAHTEDGLLFSVTFEKYSDGTVYLAEANILPCWVYRDVSYYPGSYTILPLDQDTADQWGTKYSISDTTVVAAQNSYSRTWAVVGEGLSVAQNYLAQQKEAREQYYYDLVFNPDKLLTEATEAPETTVATETE